MIHLLYLVGLVVGVLLLVKSADWLTDAAIEVAHRLQIPQIIVGATLVSIATTLPEFAVSFSAALRGEVDMSVGNAVGSTICNVGLILGLCAVLSPIVVVRQGFLSSGLELLGLVIVFWILGFVFPDGSRWTGLTLVVCLVVYLGNAVRGALAHRRQNNDAAPPPAMTTRKVLLLFIVGVCGIAVGSELMLESGIRLAYALGVSKLVVGLTFLAVGTSTPEIVVSLTGIIKRQRALSVGNILGANIMNLAWVVGTCSLLTPLPVRPQTRFFDLPVTALLSVLLLIFGVTGQRISRREGAALLFVYAAYLVIVFAVFQGQGIAVP